jgi:hypothetical protein
MFFFFFFFFFCKIKKIWFALCFCFLTMIAFLLILSNLLSMSWVRLVLKSSSSALLVLQCSFLFWWETMIIKPLAIRLQFFQLHRIQGYIIHFNYHIKIMRTSDPRLKIINQNLNAQDVKCGWAFFLLL